MALSEYKEVTTDPGFESDVDLVVSRSEITISSYVPKLDSGYSVETVFSQRCKTELYDLLLDRILTPRGLPGIEYNNYFTRVDWSSDVLNSAFPYYKPKCLLGTLTSNFHLRIYDTKERQQYVEKSVDIVFAKSGLLPYSPARARGEEDQGEVAEDLQLSSSDEAGINYHDGWIPVLDITSEYNKHLLTSWLSTSQSEFQFETYKNRLYELVIVDFGWLPNFQEEESTEGSLAFLLTFHGNGDLVTWWISVSEDRTLKAEVASKIILGTGCIASKHKCYKISPTLGILAVGFNNGEIKLYRLEGSQTENNRPRVIIEQIESIWESDELQTEFMEFVAGPEDITRVKTPSVTLVVVKHPHYVISFKLEICPDRIVAQEMNTCESPHGTIVGMSHYSPGLLLTMHETGKFSWVVVKQHQIEIDLDVGNIVEPDVVEEESDYTDSHKIHSLDPEYTELWACCGFALSPNGTLGLSTKTLKRTADTIVIKEGSACTFFSIFPSDDKWNHVKSRYEQSGCFIQKIPDVLQGFRHLLRMNGEYDFNKYFAPELFDNMSVAELKLYIWVLRAMGLPSVGSGSGKPSMSIDMVESVSINILRQVTLAQERVMEKHHLELINNVFQHGRLLTDNLESSSRNLKSAFAILQYLRSKPHLQIPKEYDVPIQIKPVCSSCERNIGFEYNRNFCRATGITSPGITGYKWNSQTCEAQHFNPVCVLSLVPFEDPHRLCPYCGCAALMEPAFGQLPLCPFCEEYMFSVPEKNVGEIMED